MRRGRKPTRKQIVAAIDKANYYAAVNAGGDGVHGLIADEIIGPLLYDHRRLRDLLARAGDAIGETADEDVPLLVRIQRALKELSPFLDDKGKA